MNSMLQDILDDILISSATDSEHRQRIDRVLEILSSRGLHKENCLFGKLWSNI